MKRNLFVIALLCLIFSCTKEEPESDKRQPEVPSSDFQALKQEVEQLKTTISSLSSGNQEQGVSKTEFEALRQENEALKAQVEMLTSGFFEVDGLRFDRNGTLISIPKLESNVSEKFGNLTLTTTRTYDTEGRVVEILRDYHTFSEHANVPYFWQKTLYEYSGKSCKTTTHTSKWGLPAGVSYEEVITQATYW